MQAKSPNLARDNRNYAADKPKECRYCYFWEGKRKNCSQKECYYLLPEEIPTSVNVAGNPLLQEFCKNGNGYCKNCPYGKHSPCIGYCIQKLLREIREKNSP